MFKVRQKGIPQISETVEKIRGPQPLAPRWQCLSTGCRTPLSGTPDPTRRQRLSSGGPVFGSTCTSSDCTLNFMAVWLDLSTSFLLGNTGFAHWTHTWINLQRSQQQPGWCQTSCNSHGVWLILRGGGSRSISCRNVYIYISLCLCLLLKLMVLARI